MPSNREPPQHVSASRREGADRAPPASRASPPASRASPIPGGPASIARPEKAPVAPDSIIVAARVTVVRSPRHPAGPRPWRPKASAAAHSPGRGAPAAATPQTGRAPPPASPKHTRAPGAYPMSGTPSPTAPSKVGASAAAPLPSGRSSVPARTTEALSVAGAPTRLRRRRECARATSSWGIASWARSTEGAGAAAAERRTCRCGDDAAPTRGRRRS